jgi:hypothetical protein
MKIRSRESRVFPRGQTGRRTDMMKLVTAFHKSANAPNKRPKSLPSEGSEIAIPKIKWLQTHVANRRANEPDKIHPAKRRFTTFLCR